MTRDSEPREAALEAGHPDAEPRDAVVEEGVSEVAFPELAAGVPDPVRTQGRNLELLLDVTIPVSVEIGRTQMCLEDVLDLVPGSVVALDKKVDELVDLRVNGKLVARGEVVLVDDAYGLRVTQVVDPEDRLDSLRK